MSSLLQQRDRARNHLDASVKNLMDLQLSGLKNTRYADLCKYRAKRAKKRLALVEKKLLSFTSHCDNSRVELYATLALIFKPELREEIEEIITFT